MANVVLASTLDVTQRWPISSICIDNLSSLDVQPKVAPLLCVSQHGLVDMYARGKVASV